MSIRRPDGRSVQELRKFSLTFDGLDGVDGSARFGFGETKALASVSGPIEVRLASEQASKATFEVMVRPLSGLPGTESKALSSSLRSALLPSMILTSNPRTLIQLVAQSITPLPSNTYTGQRPYSLRSSPPLVASIINASSLAMMNASSFPMRGIVCAIGVGRRQASRTLIADPSEEELSELDGGGTFAFLVSGSADGSNPALDLVWSNWNAALFDEDELVQATILAEAGAEMVWQHVKNALTTKIISPRPLTGKAAAAKALDDDKMDI